MRILVIGRDGQIGRELITALAPCGEVSGAGRAEFDLADPAAIRRHMRMLQPQLVVNAAAYTDVERAEHEAAQAFAINAEAPQVLAEEARIFGARLIHFSSDCVFDGTAGIPYDEAASPNPLSVYGKSKLVGEQNIAATGCRYWIFRTAWVFGSTGNSFLLKILHAANERSELRVVADQFGAPSWSRELAGRVAQAVRRLESDKSKNESGIFHLTARGRVSRHGYAARIVERGCKLGLCPHVPVHAISSDEWPTRVRRPANSLLDNSRFRAAFDVEGRSWETGLDACLQELASGSWS